MFIELSRRTSWWRLEVHCPLDIKPKENSRPLTFIDVNINIMFMEYPSFSEVVFRRDNMAMSQCTLCNRTRSVINYKTTMLMHFLAKTNVSSCCGDELCILGQKTEFWLFSSPRVQTIELTMYCSVYQLWHMLHTYRFDSSLTAFNCLCPSIFVSLPYKYNTQH